MIKPGAELSGSNSCSFSVWAPEKESMVLHIVHPADQKIDMKKDSLGYFSVTVKEITDECRYYFMPEGEEDFPDPASHFQPEGVNGPSQVIDHGSYIWKDTSWRGLPLRDMIFYEIHTGTFSEEGTFEGIIPFLEEIAEFGINALEIMPVSQFPGSRNWGYDGVFPYAVQNTYGGPTGLKKLVEACHSFGMAIFMDVVYNHLGPEGNYLSRFAPYFTDKYRTPWGNAINLDDAWCDGVREYFSDNPGHWFSNYHIDGVRLDAIHAIYDSGAVHFWELTQKKVKRLIHEKGRQFYLVAESDLNDPKVIKPIELGGYGFDAQWLDDFHHAMYVQLHKKGKSRYEDFGRIEQLSKAFTDGFIHSGEMVKFRKRRHGASSAGIDGDKFVVFNQNHDQVGNRVIGERLSMLVDLEQLKIASAAIFLSPYIPLLFMGEEYGEDNPFYYFVSHSDELLIDQVREGRKEEFKDFMWEVEPPDPQSEETFFDSKIDRSKRLSGKYKILYEWNKTLISLRKSDPVFKNTSKNDLSINQCPDNGFILHRKSEDQQKHLLCFFNFSGGKMTFSVPDIRKSWIKMIDSQESRWIENKVKEEYSSPLEIKAKQNIAIQGYSVIVYRDNDSDII